MFSVVTLQEGNNGNKANLFSHVVFLTFLWWKGYWFTDLSPFMWCADFGDSLLPHRRLINALSVASFLCHIPKI